MRLTARCGISAHDCMATFILSGMDSDFTHCWVLKAVSLQMSAISKTKVENVPACISS